MRTLPTLSRRSRPSTVILSCVTLLATGTLTASPALASGPIPSDLTFTDHQTGRKTVNLGGHDEFGVGAIELTNGILKQGATTIGRSAGSCVVTRLGATSADALCTFTFVLTSQGQVTIQGIVRSTRERPRHVHTRDHRRHRRVHLCARHGHDDLVRQEPLDHPVLCTIRRGFGPFRLVRLPSQGRLRPDACLQRLAADFEFRPTHSVRRPTERVLKPGHFRGIWAGKHTNRPFDGSRQSP